MKQTSKRWKDPTDPYNLKLFSVLTYRTETGIPMIKKYTESPPTTFIPSHLLAGTPQPKTKRHGFAHFYLDDYQIERFWNYPIRYVKYLQTFDGVLTPDYSIYSDYPLDQQRFNRYRNRALGAYWQYCGLKVIPSISWSDQRSFEYCFDAIEPGSIVSISTVGALRTKSLKERLVVGYGEMIRRLKPSKVIIYGRYMKELDRFDCENIRVPSYHERFEHPDRKIIYE